MDIREIQGGSTRPTESTRRARGGSSSTRADQAKEGSADSVALSGQAQAFQQARRAALAVPEVRQDRVTEIRDQVAKGSLVLDPSRIARALLDHNVLD